MRVLFIGNSHTYYNDMPRIFREICENYGEKTEVVMLAHGGMGLDFHQEQPEVRFNIRYGNYDVVILQHVAHPMGDPEVMRQAAECLIRWGKEAGARPVLYETWTTKEDGKSRQPGMSSMYEKIAGENQVELAPVGDVWWEYHERHPEIELYAEDGRHASVNGSRLAAFTLASAVLGVQPESLIMEPEDSGIAEAVDAVR